MDRQQTIAFLIDHYQHPRNRTLLEDADVARPGGVPGCGDTVTIYIKVDQPTDRIARLTFEGEGCTISQAAASLLTELLQDAALAQIETLDVDFILDALGREVVSSRPRCATLAFNTLKSAVAQYRVDQKRAQIAADQVARG